ncbi:hypothetical protein EMPG_09812 [Blastomyces silverae]|uniref:Uncharacterized protein n=1 Tax=Blastomyces silverae TaxID=2060906 RepID=A0A0H1BHT9_9EURO|nr:hypothetical protein EMPG_09812 [Blastomyces silverae]
MQESQPRGISLEGKRDATSNIAIGLWATDDMMNTLTRLQHTLPLSWESLEARHPGSWFPLDPDSLNRTCTVDLSLKWGRPACYMFDMKSLLYLANVGELSSKLGPIFSIHTPHPQPFSYYITEGIPTQSKHKKDW